MPSPPKLLLNNPICSNLKKSVIDLYDGCIYESVTEAAKFYNISRSYLSNMLLGRVNNKTTLIFYGK